MRTVTLEELRTNMDRIVGEVESGESISILRDGKAIVELTPARLTPHPRWKNRPPLVQLDPPDAASRALEAERAEARY